MSIPLARLTLHPDEIVELRRAELQHVLPIVSLLSADSLGHTRDGIASDSDLARYQLAFGSIDADPAQLLVVAVRSDDVVATMQLTFIPGLSRRGSLRAQVEAVRVHESYRSKGLGTAMLEWGIDEARRRGCGLVQLTTDRTRQDAHRFYARRGFVNSHDGYKMSL